MSNCWDVKNCTPEIRIVCPAHIEGRGKECWKVTGTKCDGGKVEKATKQEKIMYCSVCSFYRQKDGAVKF